MGELVGPLPIPTVPVPPIPVDMSLFASISGYDSKPTGFNRNPQVHETRRAQIAAPVG